VVEFLTVYRDFIHAWIIPVPNKLVQMLFGECRCVAIARIHHVMMTKVAEN